jgi:hypothetical protein
MLVQYTPPYLIIITTASHLASAKDRHDGAYGAICALGFAIV